MAEPNRERNHVRIKAAVAVAAFHALIGYALISGFAVDLASKISDNLKVFDIPEELPPPPPPSIPDPVRKDAEEGAAAPPSLKANPTPVVAPPPKIQLNVPPPVASVPEPKPVPPGLDSTAGVSTIPGTGTGTGGEGTGTGSGGQGDGSGGGGLAARAERIRGALTNQDYRLVARGEQPMGTVHVRFTVEKDGRVSGCTVTRSSGHDRLDGTTCRLIERRFRYRPAFDKAGRPARDVVNTNFFWGPSP